MQKRVLSVGQCGFDHGNIARVMQQEFGAVVTAVVSKQEAVAVAGTEKFDLVLVNRLMDADGAPGLDIIRAFKEHEALQKLPLMLVSNYEDAQKEAIALGALPGFGKAALEQPLTIARVAAVLNAKN